jgi:acetylornithine deacetylase
MLRHELSRAIIAIDLQERECRGVLADLRGTVVAEDHRAATPSEQVQAVLACLRRLRDAAAARHITVAAVVIGIPADSGLDLRGVLAEHVSEPLLTEDGVKLAALGEARHGEAVGDVLVTLSITERIAGAVVAGGRLVRGTQRAAGRFGAIVTGVEGRRAPVALEALASGRAIARRADELLAAGELASRLLRPATAGEVLDAAADGDQLALTVLDETLDHLAMGIIAIAAVVAPSSVILDGDVGRALEPHLDALRERVAGRLAAAPELRISRLGPEAPLTGAITAGLELVRASQAAAGVMLAALPRAEARAPELRPDASIRERIVDSLEADRALDLLRTVVAIPSVTGDERFLAGVVVGELHALGFDRVELDEFAPGRANAWGVMPGDGGNGLLLVAHLDTVRFEGRGDERDGVERDGELWGSGAVAKAGIATALASLWLLALAGLRPRRELTLACVADKESGGASLGMKALVGRLRAAALPRPDFAVYLEPTQLGVCTAQMGFVIARLRVREAGTDALVAALERHAEAVAASGAHPMMGGPSLVVGDADGDTVAVLRSVLPGERLEVAAAALEAAVASAGLDVDVTYPAGRDHPLGGRPTELSPRDARVDRLRGAIRAVRPDRGDVRGARLWSEVSFLADLGIPAAYFGPGDGALSGTSVERVSMDEFLDSVTALALFIAEHCGIEEVPPRTAQADSTDDVS